MVLVVLFYSDLESSAAGSILLVGVYLLWAANIIKKLVWVGLTR